MGRTGRTGEEDWRSKRTMTRAAELQLPVAVLGEAAPQALPPPDLVRVPRRVVDLSALWARPLCAGLLACAGADVVRIESIGRPDPTPQTSPLLDAQINAGKSRVALDCAELRAGLRSATCPEADVLVTSARPAALALLQGWFRRIGRT
jgi:hypothetical protein